jgi:hypothetical protein
MVGWMDGWIDRYIRIYCTRSGNHFWGWNILWSGDDVLAWIRKNMPLNGSIDGEFTSLDKKQKENMEVSWNRGTPKSSISMVFSMNFWPSGANPHFGNPLHPLSRGSMWSSMGLVVWRLIRLPRAMVTGPRREGALRGAEVGRGPFEQQKTVPNLPVDLGKVGTMISFMVGNQPGCLLMWEMNHGNVTGWPIQVSRFWAEPTWCLLYLLGIMKCKKHLLQSGRSSCAAWWRTAHDAHLKRQDDRIFKSSVQFLLYFYYYH